jgi:N6-L-threonylcarbamoyladenine synthase
MKMPRILGIDSSNYTTSVAVVEDKKLVYDQRILLNTKKGERGLRQSEALFQHVKNLPVILNSPMVGNIDGVCVSTRPRPVEGSYMPVFKAGESIAEAIAYTNCVPIIRTSHQEGHIEAAVRSIDFNYEDFIALHLSGGTTEALRVKKDEDYKIDIIGGTKDISIGQFIDRIGVALGMDFPAGKYVDELALNCGKSELRIPSRVDGMYFNLSGQETQGLRYINNGNNLEEVAHAVMLCAAKTLDKLFANIFSEYELPVLLTGGVASSAFLKNYFSSRYKGSIYFSNAKYASDNAVGAAYIGYRKLMGW